MDVGTGSAAKRQSGIAGQEDGLYERETERAAISRAIAAARCGAGGLVLVEGPAGIGKSRLLAEARATAGALGLTVLSARGIDLERDAPFGVAASLFAAPLTAAPAGERARLLDGHAALAAALFDPAAADHPAADHPAADPSALVRGLYWLTANLAAPTHQSSAPRCGGLLIAVDDAQWADDPSLSYLAYLAARIDELPAVLVIALRNGELPTGERAVGRQALDWLKQQSGRSLLRPGALSPEAVAAMARTELPGAEPAFTQACAEACGGNPFLAT
jgi:hypothetical protein